MMVTFTLTMLTHLIMVENLPNKLSKWFANSLWLSFQRELESLSHFCVVFLSLCSVI